MHILLTGATGYIGKRLLYKLLKDGHEVTCCVRDPKRFKKIEGYEEAIHIIETDFKAVPEVDDNIKHVDAAYYLIHSLSTSTTGYKDEELQVAKNFSAFVEKLQGQQVIYLGGIANEKHLSEHLSSRRGVEDILKQGSYNTTILRAAIIVGSGSASFEIIRDLVEKLPIMITPKWVNTKCQPIAIKNVLDYLVGVLKNKQSYNKTFDIGGPDILTYKEMMLGFGEVRGLKRYILTLPVMTPRLSSYWLYFITATNYTLAVNLVKSMKVEVICKDNSIQDIVKVNLIDFKEAVDRAFGKIEQNMVVSSWKDALSSSNTKENLNQYIQVPTNGCFIDARTFELANTVSAVEHKIWSIGGNNGWYYANWLWQLRGFLDKLVGGVGLRRGRTNENTINSGESLDFWRVLVADSARKRLLLYAEMKLPGEAWLEFKIINNQEKNILVQKATFRPRGLSGRFYWYLVSPLHHFIFNGMGSNIAKG